MEKCYLSILLGFSMFDEVFPLFASTKKIHNGLDWDSSTIGILLAVAGVISIISMIFYPFIVKYVGVLRSYQIALFVLICMYLLFSFNSELDKVAPVPVVWVAVTIGLLTRTVLGEACYTSQYLIIGNSVAAEHNGTINGIAQSLASAGYAAAGIVGGTLFSWSLELLDIAQGFWKYVPFEKMVYIFGAFAATCAFIIALRVPKSLENRKN